MMDSGYFDELGIYRESIIDDLSLFVDENGIWKSSDDSDNGTYPTIFEEGIISKSDSKTCAVDSHGVLSDSFYQSPNSSELGDDFCDTAASLQKCQHDNVDEDEGDFSQYLKTSYVPKYETLTDVSIFTQEDIQLSVPNHSLNEFEQLEKIISEDEDNSDIIGNYITSLECHTFEGHILEDEIDSISGEILEYNDINHSEDIDQFNESFENLVHYNDIEPVERSIAGDVFCESNIDAVIDDSDEEDNYSQEYKENGELLETNITGDMNNVLSTQITKDTLNVSNGLFNQNSSSNLRKKVPNPNVVSHPKKFNTRPNTPNTPSTGYTMQRKNSSVKSEPIRLSVRNPSICSYDVSSREEDNTLTILQDQYNDLLQKYASAENVIDNLRVEVEYSNLTSSNKPAFRRSTSDIYRTSKSSISRSVSNINISNHADLKISSNHTIINPSNSSLAGEHTQMMDQINKVMDQCEALQILLNEQHLNVSDQEVALQNVKDGFEKLQSEFHDHKATMKLNNIKEHDCDRTVASELFILSMKIDNLQQIIAENIKLSMQIDKKLPHSEVKISYNKDFDSLNNSRETFLKNEIGSKEKPDIKNPKLIIVNSAQQDVLESINGKGLSSRSQIDGHCLNNASIDDKIKHNTNNELENRVYPSIEKSFMLNKVGDAGNLINFTKQNTCHEKGDLVNIERRLSTSMNSSDGDVSSMSCETIFSNPLSREKVYKKNQTLTKNKYLEENKLKSENIELTTLRKMSRDSDVNKLKNENIELTTPRKMSRDSDVNRLKSENIELTTPRKMSRDSDLDISKNISRRHRESPNERLKKVDSLKNEILELKMLFFGDDQSFNTANIEVDNNEPKEDKVFSSTKAVPDIIPCQMIDKYTSERVHRHISPKQSPGLSSKTTNNTIKIEYPSTNKTSKKENKVFKDQAEFEWSKFGKKDELTENVNHNKSYDYLIESSKTISRLKGNSCDNLNHDFSSTCRVYTPEKRSKLPYDSHQHHHKEYFIAGDEQISQFSKPDDQLLTKQLCPDKDDHLHESVKYNCSQHDTIPRMPGDPLLQDQYLICYPVVFEENNIPCSPNRNESVHYKSNVIKQCSPPSPICRIADDNLICFEQSTKPIRYYVKENVKRYYIEAKREVCPMCKQGWSQQQFNIPSQNTSSNLSSQNMSVIEMEGEMRSILAVSKKLSHLSKRMKDSLNSELEKTYRQSDRLKST